MTVHVRVNGWCGRCAGHGLAAVEHVDSVLGLSEVAVADVDHIRRDTLRLVSEHVRRQVDARLVELADGHGCEAAAAGAFEQGRLRVVEHDMWEAVGLTPR
jgi:hypothetical protein